MKKARTEIVKVKIKDDKILNVSIVKKQSQLGLSYNDRLFILVENQKFGYISHFTQSDKPENIDISKCKVIVPIKNIVTEVQRSKEVIMINFFLAQDKEKVQKKWTLKMETEELAKQWQKLIIQEKNKSVIRKNQSVSKVSGQLSPKKSQIRPLINQSNVAPQQGQNASHKNLQQVKQELKQDLGKKKSHKPEKQEFQNVLYETQNKGNFALESPTLNPNQKDGSAFQNQNQSRDLNQSKDMNQSYMQNNNEDPNKTSQFISDNQAKTPAQDSNRNQANQNPNEKPNIAKKLSYDEETEIKKKLVEEIKRSEEQKLRKQKQQIRKKQQQLAEMERKIKEEQKRIQDEKKMLEQSKKKQQSGVKNSQVKEPTVINEDFFHKPKQDQKQDASASKSKPKIEGPNYSQFVNNVIMQKPKPQPEALASKKPSNLPQSPRQSQNPLQLAHSYLLKIQQLKLQNHEAQLREKQRQMQQKMKSKIIEQNEEQNPSLEFGWTYRFLLKQKDLTQDQVIVEFNQYCSNVLKEAVEEFHLPERKRMFLPKYRREEYYLYEKDDVQFKLAFIGLKEIYNKDEPDSRDNICDSRAVKILQNQFKNYHLMYRACQEIQSKCLKVPLACVCQYQGFVAFFKARSQLDSKAPANTADKKVQTDLQRISQNTRISLLTLKNKQNVLIYKLNNEYYRQLAQKTGKNHTTFDYYIIQQLKNILPKGVLVPDQNSQESPEQPHFIRPQLLLNYQQPRQDINETISETLKKVQTYHSRVASSNKLAQSVLINIAYLIRELDDLNFYFVHPKEISEKMHQFGVNVRSLGLVYENCQGEFNRKYLMTEMAARTARSLFRKTIQDCNSKQSQQAQNTFQQNIYFQMLDFFNLILGSSNETATIWKVLSVHNSDYFNIPLVLDEIQKGYFVLSLIYHCQIEVQWSKISLSQAFISNQFFNQNNFIGVKIKIKGYEPVLNQKQQDLINKMIGEDPNAIKTLEQQFGLHSNGLPLKFKSQKYLNILKKYLSNFVPPQASMQRGYKNLNLYNSSSNRLTKSQFEQRLMELKWHLKRQRKQKYLQVFSQLNSEIVNCFGNFHPFLSQLYETMVMYHRNNGEFEDSITFSKSSVINMLKICGAMHPKVAQSYYQMAFSCIKGGKKQLAIISLQKAKNIFQANQKQGQISYAFVCMKLGLMFLSEGKDAESIVKYALKLFNRALASNMNKSQAQAYEQQRVQCFQILARYYELNDLTEKQKQLSLQCQKQLNYIQTPGNFEKLLKIVLFPVLSSVSPANASIYLSLISEIPLQISVETYEKGYQRLIQRVDEGTLVQNLIKYLENVKSIQNFIKENKTLNQWKGLQEIYERETVTDFVSLTVEMLYFLGEGYVTGTVRDTL